MKGCSLIHRVYRNRNASRIVRALGIVSVLAPLAARAVPPDWDAANDPNTGAEARSATAPRIAVAPTQPPDSAGTSGDYVDTGSDTCSDAFVIDLHAGPPGEPTWVTVRGDYEGTTGPDCDGSLGDVWWEAFHVDQCATITIDFCNSPPRSGSIFMDLAVSCADDGAPCGSFASASESSPQVCDFNNLNLWMSFTEIPPGTYYYPIAPVTKSLFDTTYYRLNVSAEQCEGSCEGCSGACCDPINRNCADVTQSTACTEPTEEWLFRVPCCEIECKPADVEFDSKGMELLSRIPIEEFPGFADMGANEMWGYVSPSGREYAIIGFTMGTGFAEVTDPTDPNVLAFIPGHVDTTWRDMDVIGHHVYIVSDGAGVGIQIVDVDRIDEGIVTLVNTTDLGVGYETAHNIRANADSGFLYLAIPNLNNRLGLTVVSTTDPVNPVIAGTWTDDTGTSVRCHDVHVVSYDEGPYAGREIAFCFAEHHGVKIVDVTNKSKMFTLSTLVYPTLRYTHQGWLSEDRRYLFIDDELDERTIPEVTETTTYVGDVQDLENPHFLTSFTSGTCAIDHNLMVRGHRVYEANYTSGLRVFDFSDINDVQPIAFFDTHPEDNEPGFLGAWGTYALPSGTILISDRQRGLFVVRLLPDPPVLGDCDGDGDLDLHDFAVFQGCFTGVDGGPLPENCTCADLDGDDDVDRDDYALLHSGLGEPTGP